MNVAIVGTGQMGSSLAYLFAQHDDFSVVYFAKSRSEAQPSTAKLESIFEKQQHKGKISEGQSKTFKSKIYPCTLSDLGDVDLIVEAVTESADIKNQVFKKLDKICKVDCIFTSNTSSLPLDLLAKDLSRTIFGLHFFNPPYIMKLVEISYPKNKSKADVGMLVSICKKLNKTPIVIYDNPGFVVNRCLLPMINESISIYEEGIASAKDIDLAMKLGTNHPMGPLELADYIGLDIVLAILQVMKKETGESRYTPCKLLTKMVDENKLGVKTGTGFYDYKTRA